MAEQLSLMSVPSSTVILLDIEAMTGGPGERGGYRVSDKHSLHHILASPVLLLACGESLRIRLIRLEAP